MKKFNICLGTDSYKLTHHNMYPQGTQKVYSYFESRTGAELGDTVFFGLQYFLKEYLEGIVVTKEMIDEADEISKLHFGQDLFGRNRWDYILEKYQGKLPIIIKSVAEGIKVPCSNVLLTIENTDDKCYWLTNHLETLLSQLWYPCTVASLSRKVMDSIEDYLEITSDFGKDFPGKKFMLHDFGFRGTSSVESAGIGGLAHLTTFMGSDTLQAIVFGRRHYSEPMAAYSVPASEHSIMTALGKNGEAKVIENLLKAYPNGIISLVSDSYNIYDCVKNLYCKEFKDLILTRDGKLVIRPDSGDPTVVIPKLIDMLSNEFGYTVNKKGYKILNSKVGLIWGDGLDIDTIVDILKVVKDIGYSVENLVFGMGGGLLQKINRDTQKFAFKSSAQLRDGIWYDIYKEPIDKSFNKTSKRGKLAIVRNSWATVSPIQFYRYITIKESELREDQENLLKTVFNNGVILKETTLNEVRQRLDKE